MLNSAHPNTFSRLIVMCTVFSFMLIFYTRILEVKIIFIRRRLAPLEFECRDTRRRKSDEANKFGGRKQ